MKAIIIITIISITCLTGCFAHNSSSVIGTNQSQVQMRNYQSRAFDTNDKALVMRAVVSTMQDLGFIISQADDKIGTISGTSFSNMSVLTVTIRQINQNRLIVRVIAQHNRRLIEDPIAYKNFFTSLSQSLFLEAHEIE